jgi:hypothetical protein
MNLAAAGCRGPGFSPGALPAECVPQDGEAPDESCGVFVEPGKQGGDGSQSKPFGTIAEALSAKKPVFICGDQAGDTAIDAPGGFILVGGHACDSWAFSTKRKTAVVGQPGVAPLRLVGGGFSDIYNMQLIAAAATAPGQSSIAVVVESGEIAFTRVDLIAASGQSGASGAPGATGVDGSNGINTVTAIGGGGAGSTCGAEGGNGGQGTTTPQPGQPGNPNQDNGGNANCTDGGPGGTGAPGFHGMNASGIGTISADGFTPAAATPGQPGGPGGVAAAVAQSPARVAEAAAAAVVEVAGAVRVARAVRASPSSR